MHMLIVNVLALVVFMFASFELFCFDYFVAHRFTQYAFGCVVCRHIAGSQLMLIESDFCIFDLHFV